MVKKSRSGKCKCNDAGPTRTRDASPLSADEKDSSTTDLASALSTTKKSLEIVEWRDANFYINDDGFEGDYIVATVGWVEEDDTWMKISSELTPDGERAVTRVPRNDVLSRRTLEIGSSPLISIIWDAPTDLI